MQRNRRSIRRVQRFLAYAASAFLIAGPPCFDSDIGRRFREAYGPGLVDGLSTVITDPTNAEVGLRQTGAALFDGLGAILQPRTGSSSKNK